MEPVVASILSGWLKRNATKVVVRAKVEDSGGGRKAKLTRRHGRWREHKSEDLGVNDKSCNVGDTIDKLQLEQRETLTSLHSIEMTLTSKYVELVLNPTNVQAHSDFWISNLQGRNSQVHGFKNSTYFDAQPGWKPLPIIALDSSYKPSILVKLGLIFDWTPCFR